MYLQCAGMYDNQSIRKPQACSFTVVIYQRLSSSGAGAGTSQYVAVEADLAKVMSAQPARARTEAFGLRL